MLCDNPYVNGNHVHACGQCLGCRIKHRRTWANRLIIESTLHLHSQFVTLTYDQENEPQNGYLEPQHLTKFLKRYRYTVYPRRIRYYACGEYGGQTDRPHYHIILFGAPPCERGETDNVRLSKGRSCCDSCDTIFKVWAAGRIHSVPFQEKAAHYITKYITKSRLNGASTCRPPEFARMSKNPGIGALFMHEVASSLMEFRLDGLSDVPNAIQIGSSTLPLGRYLRRRLRLLVGRSEETPQSTHQETYDRLSSLRKTATRITPTGKGRNQTLKDLILAKYKGKLIQIHQVERRNKPREKI